MDSRPAAGAGSTFTIYLPESKFHVHCWRMAPTIEKISAITFRVLNMKASVQFYRNVLGKELLYGGEQASFSFLFSARLSLGTFTSHARPSIRSAEIPYQLRSISYHTKWKDYAHGSKQPS